MASEGELQFGAELSRGKHLSVVTSAHAKLSTTMVKGQLKPARQGWISQAYGTLTPNFALGYSQSGKSALFVTLLSIDDIGSSISTNEMSIELSVLTKEGAERLVIEFEGELCCVERRLHD